jgi:maltose phosphorylase
MEEKAYEMYMRTARLDLDDYNHEADEGLHITSMAGTWMAVVEGFGGKRVVDGKLSLKPMLPKSWEGYQFNLVYRDVILSITVDSDTVTVASRSDVALEMLIYGEPYTLHPEQPIRVKR